MTSENEYTDAAGVRYVAANPFDYNNPCAGCAHEHEQRPDDGCSAAPPCARIIWVKAEDGSHA